MNTTGDRIRELRIKHKLTLDDVAQYLGVGRQAIYKYEHGTVTNIPLDNIEKMAKLFGVAPGYLSGWTADSESDIPTNDELKIISAYRALSPRGQQLLMDRAEELKLLYGKKSESPADIPVQARP